MQISRRPDIEPMKRDARDQRSVIEKVSDVLSAFSSTRPELTLAEVTRLTRLPHATARRILYEMTAAGLLERTEAGTFVIGTRLWETGSLAPRTLPLRTVAMPFMSVLHEALHQHVQLAVLEGGEAVVIERLSTTGAVGLVSQIGGRLPLHTSAAGKVLLAHAPPEIFDQVMTRPLRKLTPFSITDPQLLARELASVRANGYATVREETSLEAGSVAAPIKAPAGKVLAAMSVLVNIRSINVQSLVPAVVSAAQGASAALRHGR
jgi:DNA-binding IclR family transcriptional regulator